MDNTFLLNHARQKIWSSPYQDLQAVIKPHRLSDDLGAKDWFQMAWLNTALPSTDSRWHVYQIGKLHPSLVGLMPIRNTWTSASQQMNVQGMIIDVYTAKGKKLPLFDCFFKVMPNSNLIFAIRDQKPVMNLIKEDLSIRFYSNAYFETSFEEQMPRLDQSHYTDVVQDSWKFPDDIRSNANPGDILVQGVRIRTRADLLALGAKVTTLRALGFGGVTCFYNGEWVTDFSGNHFTLDRVKRGDWAEFVFDASIEKMQRFKVSDLKTFRSIKDGVDKYILQRDTEWTGEVHYKDDYDIYLIAPEGHGGARGRGRYYYRNTPSAMRMITHQDYSIPVMGLTAYEDQMDGFEDPFSWTVLVVYRLSGYSQKHLVNDHMRLNEFFRLPIDVRLKAMRGIDSTIEWWRADNLENSDLAVLFGERPFNFTTKQVEDALGYYGVSKLINPCMINVELSPNRLSKSAQLPVGLQQLATVFEYDGKGKLLGYRTVTGGSIYICDSLQCEYVEGIAGRGSRYQGTFFGDGPHQLDSDWDYGFYKKQIIGGVPTGEWLVADPKDYRVDGRSVAWWNLSEANWHMVIRSNKDFLLYEIQVDARDGLSIFSIQSIEENEHEPLNRVEDLPFGQVDLFFNNHPLIYGIDYLGSWPEFVITNTEFIADTGLQDLVIRCSGLPEVVNGQPAMRKPEEVGFVKYGKLSRNRKYNARTGKVQRYTVRGGSLPKSKLNFSEDTGTPVVSPVKNGDPYAIENVVVPVGNFTADDTTTLRQRDVERDSEIEDFMSLYFTDKVEDNPNPIENRYRLVAPMMTKVIHDILHGLLHVPVEIVPVTQGKLKELLKDYLYLLPYDPYTVGMDWDSVQLIPHANKDRITVGFYEYSALALMNKIYYGDTLDFANFLKLDPAWKPIPLPPL